MSLEIERVKLRAIGEDFYQVDPLEDAVVYSPRHWQQATGEPSLTLPVQPNQQEIYLAFQHDKEEGTIESATLIYFDKVLGRPAQEYLYRPQSHSGIFIDGDEDITVAEDFRLRELTTYSYEIDCHFAYPLSPQPIPVVRVETSNWAVDKNGRKKRKVGVKIINALFPQVTPEGGVGKYIFLSESQFESAEEAQARFAYNRWLREQALLTNRASFWVEKTRAFLFSNGSVYYERDVGGSLVRLLPLPDMRLEDKIDIRFPQALTKADVIYT